VHRDAAVANGGDRADVDQRDATEPHDLREDPLGRSMDAPARQIADEHAHQRPEDQVAQRQRDPERQRRHHLRRQAESVARDHVDLAPDAQVDCRRALLAQLEGEFGPGVPGADHEHALPAVRVGVPEVGAVGDLAAESQLALERRPVRHGVVPTRYDEMPGLVLARGSRDAPPLTVERLGKRDPLAEARGKLERARVVLEVRDEALARHVRRPVAGHGVMRQARVAARRVQVKPLVVASPRAADGARAFHDDEVASCSAKARTDREAGRIVSVWIPLPSRDSGRGRSS
jgi:hypothetical protein